MVLPTVAQENWMLLALGFLALASLVGSIWRTLFMGYAAWRILRLAIGPAALAVGASYFL